MANLLLSVQSGYWYAIMTILTLTFCCPLMLSITNDIDTTTIPRCNRYRTDIARTSDAHVDFLLTSRCLRRPHPRRALCRTRTQPIYLPWCITTKSQWFCTAVEGSSKDLANDGERIERGVRFVPAHTGHHRPRWCSGCQGHPRLPIRGEIYRTHIISYYIISRHDLSYRTLSCYIILLELRSTLTISCYIV